MKNNAIRDMRNSTVDDLTDDSRLEVIKYLLWSAELSMKFCRPNRIKKPLIVVILYHQPYELHAQLS